jgi:hypothetical protein
MAFGKGDGPDDTMLVNSQSICKLLPHKQLHEIEAYAKLFDYYITNIEPGNITLPGNIPSQCVFFDKKPTEVRLQQLCVGARMSIS